MRKINNILIPIDFSHPSINALKIGLEMAQISLSHVYVLHAFRLIDAQHSIKNNEAIELKNKLKNMFQTKLKELKTTHADTLGVTSFFDLQIGFPEDVIESFLMNNSIDIAIMSMTGAGKNTAPFGSTISSIVNTRCISILALPENVNHTMGSNDILNQLIKKNQPEPEPNPNTGSGLVSIANEDFENYKKTLEQERNEELNRKTYDPVFIYC